MVVEERAWGDTGIWGRGQVSQRTLGQGNRLAFYFKYDGTLMKGSKLWSDHLIYSYQYHPSYRMELKNKREKNTEKRCQKQTLGECWGCRGDNCVLLSTVMAKTWTEVATSDIMCAKEWMRGMRNEGKTKNDHQKSSWSSYVDGNTI